MGGDHLPDKPPYEECPNCFEPFPTWGVYWRHQCRIDDRDLEDYP